MGKSLFYILGIAIYSLMIYCIIPYVMRSMDFSSGTDPAGGGMARAFSYFGYCVLWSVIFFLLQMVIEWSLYHAVWRSIICLVFGMFLVWGLYGGNEIWKDNQRHDITTYYATGEVERTGIGIGPSKKEHGEITTYYRNGKVKSIETFVLGKVNGYCRMYYENGNLRSEGNIVSSDCGTGFDGEWKYYRESGKLDDVRKYSSGVLLSSQNYKLVFDGKRGICTIKDAEPYTGALDKTPVIDIKEDFPYLYTCSVINGVIREGDVVSYYPNSQLAFRCVYVDGKIEGDYVAYYEDSIPGHLHGTVSYTCFYKEDKQNGVARWYNADGSIRSEQPHKMGMKVGAETRYYYQANGGEDLTLQIFYINGEQLNSIITSAGDSLDREHLDIYLEGSEPGFIKEFEYWRHVDPSWLLMKRTLSSDTLECMLNAGQDIEGCYAILRNKVVPRGILLPEKLPQNDKPVTVQFPVRSEAQSAKVEKDYSVVITVDYPQKVMTYELSLACIGTWVHVTTIKKSPE